MSQTKDEFYSPAPKMMLTVMIVGTVGCIAFGVLNQFLDIGWLFPCAITFGMFAYHMLIRFISPVILALIFHKKYDYQKKWFQQKLWEKRLYQFLKVKNWKEHVMTYNPSEFSMKVHSMEEIVNNMCHAEVVHELIVVLSFTSLLFAIPFGAWGVFLITAICAALVDCMFVVIQRYNRPRLVQLMKKQRK